MDCSLSLGILRGVERWSVGALERWSVGTGVLVWGQGELGGSTSPVLSFLDLLRVEWLDL